MDHKGSSSVKTCVILHDRNLHVVNKNKIRLDLYSDCQEKIIRFMVVKIIGMNDYSRIDRLNHNVMITILNYNREIVDDQI